MAAVQATPTVSAQARTVRATMTWPPPTGLMQTRPWRSSPLARPTFSTLPPIISESSEESYENDFAAPENPRAFGQTQRSPSSSSSLSDSPVASGYTSRNASGSASALMLVQDEASTSSISLHVSSSAHGTPTASSSHGHGNFQTHSNRPARLSKSPQGRRPSSAQENLLPRNMSETSITPPPRARTVSHGHSRSTPFLAHPIAPSPTIPQAYSRASPRPKTSPEVGTNTSKQPPSTSRDPSSNWMSSSPFGPASVPKFSRLAMASPAVVMPLSAREYRKRKARGSVAMDKEKEPPTSSNRVTFSDTALSALQPTPNGVPLVRVSPPPSEDVHEPRSPPSSSGHRSPDRQPQPQPQLDHPPSKPLPHAPLSAQTQLKPRPSSPKQKRPRSRPNTPPRSSPLAAHPPISPKSSVGTFFSLASVSDDDMAPPTPSHPQGADDPNATNAVPLARPRPRMRRRKSFPDRLSNGARLSLLEAMNRLSQESMSQHRLSGLSQTDGANRLSMASQASGHTLFYDVVESEGDDRVAGGVEHGNGDGDGSGGGQRTSILHTQSLEDLSSTLARTGIEVVHPNGDGDPGAPLDDERKGKRNVRTVRISDTVEVSPAPVPRRRKLTKSRPGSARGSAPAFGSGAGSAPGTGTVKETKVQTQTQTRTQTQTQERRSSLLPWKSKGSGDSSKGGVVGARSGATGAGAGEKSGEDGHPSTPTGKGHVHPIAPIANGSTLVESHSKLGSTSPTKKPSSDTPTSTPSTSPRKTHRYTFSFLSTPTFHRHKREKSNTAPAGADLGSDQHATKGKPKESTPKSVESGTDSTSTSIRTITQGSQSTITPASPLLYDLTTLASSGALPLAGRGTGSSAVPMLRRLNAQAMATVGAPPLQSAEWDGGGDSTPSLITNGSTATSSSVPRTFTLPSFVRLPGEGGEPFVPRPSALKELFTDTSEEEEGVHGEMERTPRVCVHRRQDQRPVSRGGVSIVGGAETPEEDEQAQLRGRSSSGLSLSLSPSPRPGTSSSTQTTATSGSYVSFSTVPASTTSSSSSTSPSESPSLMMNDKRDLSGDGDVYSCALCGHFVSPSMSPSPSPSHFVTREPDPVVMHPMFTVPLVTVPASAVSSVGTYPRSTVVSSSNTPRAGMRDAGGGARYGGGRKSEKHLSVPVPAAVGVPAARSNHDHGHNYNQNHMHVHAPGPTATTRTMTTALSQSPSPPKVKKHRRPQTAPPGTGDAAFKFIEDARAMRAREGSVDVHVGGDRPTKHKVGSGESKFKTVLKGLLRWHG